jgi:hypothetical protein
MSNSVYLVDHANKTLYDAGRLILESHKPDPRSLNADCYPWKFRNYARAYRWLTAYWKKYRTSAAPELIHRIATDLSTIQYDAVRYESYIFSEDEYEEFTLIGSVYSEDQDSIGKTIRELYCS